MFRTSGIPAANGFRSVNQPAIQDIRIGLSAVGTLAQLKWRPTAINASPVD
jgi:hypothetical protein